MSSKIEISHIGFITGDIELFEEFWVGIMGFKKIWDSELSPELTDTLFGTDLGAKCSRYKKDDVVIEFHKFNGDGVKEVRFNRFGFNHICLKVKNKQKFLAEHGLKAKVYNNPKGHQNVFIRDFEGNWIELWEDLK